MNIKIGRFPYSAGSRSNAIDEKSGLVKVIADENNALERIGYEATTDPYRSAVSAFRGD